MKELIKKLICGKKVLILGFGREGRSTLSMLELVGGYSCIYIADQNEVDANSDSVSGYYFKEEYLKHLDEFDVVFKSPGIVLDRPEEDIDALIVCQTELFIKAYRDRVIGITGTKGKSTTSSLLYHVLKSAGKDVLFAGNIGIPVFDIDEEVNDGSLIVLELSCHQLEYAKTSPKRAVLLNIYEDHLDHYKTRDKYVKAKQNIYLYQNTDDTLYTTFETTETDGAVSKIKYIKKDILPIKSWDEIPDAKLLGEHNLTNAAFVYEIAKELDVSDEVFVKALSDFKPLAHRLSFVGNFDGIDYYDDSISTTVMSAINAVKSVKNASVLLLGGMERNIDYTELVKFVKTSGLEAVVCMYDSGKRIYKMLTDETDKESVHPIYVCVDNMEKAIEWTKANAKKGGACLLSPAAASYGVFKNFEERGDFFVKLVANLTK